MDEPFARKVEQVQAGISQSCPKCMTAKGSMHKELIWDLLAKLRHLVKFLDPNQAKQRVELGLPLPWCMI